MKKISFRLILAALAATAALTACTKEITPPNFENDKVDSAAEGTRVIAVSFAPQTKTEPGENLQPKFADGDSILLVNSKNITEACKVSVDDEGIATISTNLTGDLTAFYPAKAAQIDERGNYAIYNTPVQTGKFADANLCSATIGESDTNVEFLNLYSLFIITPPDGTVILKIKSLKGIGEDGQRSGNSVPINIINSVIEASKTITLPDRPDEDGKYYVAIVNARLSDLSFEAWFDEDGKTGSIKGIPTSVIEQQAAATGIENYGIIQKGTAYTIDDSNWHEYVTVGDRKWATVNIGAEKPEDAGRYFAWGDTLGQVRDTINDIPFETPYNWANAPFNNDSDTYNDTYFKSVMANVCPNGVLSLKYDAANCNWGGAWRMPTGGELQYFENYSEFVPEGIKSGDLLLPKTGYVEDTTLKMSEKPYCLSSCIDTDNNSCPPVFLDGDTNKEAVNVTASFGRYYGFPIRAIVDDSYSLPVVINTDTDKDGVIDEKDNCPNTPPEAKVDLQGCPLDSDGDGVPDYLDKCLGTSAEAIGKVDELGCPLDSDGDGVPDYLDKCPETPAAAKGYVDANGCPLDSDGDGVYDYEDACPSVAGIKENKGCPEVK